MTIGRLEQCHSHKVIGTWIKVVPTGVEKKAWMEKMYKTWNKIWWVIKEELWESKTDDRIWDWKTEEIRKTSCLGKTRRVESLDFGETCIINPLNGSR